MEVRSKVRREDKVAVMFSAEMKARLDKLAEAFGMPPSTLCAFAVASWVQQQENNVSMARMAVMQMARQVGEKVDGPEFAAMVQSAVVAAAKAQGDPQGLLPLVPGADGQ